MTNTLYYSICCAGRDSTDKRSSWRHMPHHPTSGGCSQQWPTEHSAASQHMGRSPGDSSYVKRTNSLSRNIRACSSFKKAMADNRKSGVIPNTRRSHQRTFADKPNVRNKSRDMWTLLYPERHMQYNLAPDARSQQWQHQDIATSTRDGAYAEISNPPSSNTGAYWPSFHQVALAGSSNRSTDNSEHPSDRHYVVNSQRAICTAISCSPSRISDTQKSDQGTLADKSTAKQTRTSRSPGRHMQITLIGLLDDSSQQWQSEYSAAYQDRGNTRDRSDAERSSSLSGHQRAPADSRNMSKDRLTCNQCRYTDRLGEQSPESHCAGRSRRDLTYKDKSCSPNRNADTQRSHQRTLIDKSTATPESSDLSSSRPQPSTYSCSSVQQVLEQVQQRGFTPKVSFTPANSSQSTTPAVIPIAVTANYNASNYG